MRTLFAILSLCGFLFGLEENHAVFQAHSMILMRDFHTAEKSVEEALRFFPDSKPLRQLHVKILAESGQIMEAIRGWQKLEKQDDAVLETMAWGVLEKAEHSDQMAVYLTSMLGAAGIQDVRAVHLIYRQLRSTNAYARAMAVSFAKQFGDEMLFKELYRMLDHEPVWYVRLEVIKSLAHFERPEVVPKLKGILEKDTSSAEEKVLAVQAIAQRLDKVGEEELETLLQSKRAAFRQLGCQIILHLNLDHFKERLVPLLQDTNNDVKCAAALALGYLGIEGLEIEEALGNMRGGRSGRLAIVAGWLSLFDNKLAGSRTLYRYATCDDPGLRRLAAAAIASGGERAFLLGQKLLKESPDPFVRVTLAKTLIGKEHLSQLASREIYTFLESEEGKIMEEQVPGTPFIAVAPSEVRHNPNVARYPEMVDQSVRLGLYNRLAIMRHPKALEAIQAFLCRQHIGIPYMAARMLVSEGGEKAFSQVKKAMQDPSPKVRLQAAIVMALLAPTDEVLQVIEGVYPRVDHHLKMQIIDALGHFGKRKSLPFLVGRLNEPYSVLRIAASSSIIRLLNH